MARRLPEYGDKLKPREIMILHMMATACTNKQIAEEIGISISAIYQHVYHIYRKICTGTKDNRVEATLFYWHSDL